MKITQETLITNKEVRDNFIDRLETLSKVKTFLLLPNTEYATTKQLAEYFEVPQDTIDSLSLYHKEELELDGYKAHRQKQIIEYLNVEIRHLERMQGKSIATFKNGEQVVLPNRGLRLFPRRAILRVAMLLRDSEIASYFRDKQFKLFY
ncbi:hypothetical protein [Priestia megaterium]|uniref:hypothetical protein n=1 Tax=Priestia megaterium TaxID=1404 RepID=UPI0018CEB1E5|nr:hypothetical protein [Priestia megaterium]